LSSPSGERAVLWPRACGALSVLCAAACGYAPVRGRPAGGLRVAAVRNATAQAEAGGVFAAELRRELARRGMLEPDSSAAPELRAEVRALRSFPSGVSAEGGAASFRVDAELRLEAPEYADTVVGSEDYLAGVDVLGTEANRRAALRRLMRTLAAAAVERYEVGQRFK
jgi:hypothetical protein